MLHDHAFRVYDDAFGIGQIKCAAIQEEIALHEMGECAEHLLSNRYVPEETLPMWSRRIRAARLDYDRARAILEAI